MAPQKQPEGACRQHLIAQQDPAAFDAPAKGAGHSRWEGISGLAWFPSESRFVTHLFATEPGIRDRILTLAGQLNRVE